MAELLDLREDFAELSASVIDRVKAFDPATNVGPGDPGPVSYIEFGFAFEQVGWVALVFDTRPEGTPDGEWTLYIDANKLDRPPLAA